MNIRRLAVGVLAAFACSPAVSAGVGVFANQVLWDNYVTVKGCTVVEQDIAGRPQGYYASLTGSGGGISWGATAKGGLFAGPGTVSTFVPSDDISLNLSFSPGVRAVGGNMFSALIKSEAMPSLVEVFLADGTSFSGFTFGSSDFIGFASTSADIVGLTITALNPGDGVMASPTIGSLYVGAVPAPGALAVLGLAGSLGRRRRR